MSDVSGIPYMGPMGMGNYFANPFPAYGTPQITSPQIQAPYMPEINYNQNVLNNLYASGGGFGQQTNYYSQLGAQYSAMGMSPFGIFSEGGGGASPYRTSPDVWNSGASPFIGGGGSSGFGGSIYDFAGGLGSLGASPYMTSPNVFDTGARGFSYPGAGAIDWGGLYNTSKSNAPDYGAGMFGGLAGSAGAYQGPNNQMDWSGVFGGGSASQQPKVDPYPGMAMPGGLNSPMTIPKEQPDFSTLFEQRAGGQDFSASSPFDVGAPSLVGADDTSRYTTAGGTGGLDWGGVTGQTYQAPVEPNQTPLSGPPVTEAYNPYYDVTSPYGQSAGAQGASAPTDTRTGTLAPGGGLSATDLSAQAREQLVKLMTGPQEPSVADIFGGDVPVPTEGKPAIPPTATEAPVDPYAALPGGIPLSGEAGRGGMVGRPEATSTAESPATRVYPGADTPRPSADIFPARRLAPNGREPELFVVHHTGGRGSPENVVNDWRTNRPGIGSQYIMDRNGVIHDTLNEYGYGGTSHATEFNIPGTGVSSKQGTSNRSIVGMEIVARDERDVTPAQLQALKEFAASRYPDVPFYGHGEISGNRMNDEGMRGTNAILDERIAAGQGWPSSSFVWPEAGAPAARVPLPTARPEGAPAAFNADVSQGPTMPNWQSSIPPAYRTPEVTAAIQAQADRFGIPPEAISAVAGVEGSGWNPQYMTKQHAGIFQIAPDDFKTAGGTLGGLTYNQYRNATPAQQVAAYGDYIASSPNAYLVRGMADPALAAALLQSIQFSPQSDAFAERYIIGDTASRTTPKAQADELGNTSIDAMRAAFARRIAGFPQTQTLPGGR